MTKQIQRKLITNAILYDGFSNSKNHKLFVTNLKFQRSKMNRLTETSKQLNILYMPGKETRIKYK